mgnify:CR=1 FL=1
MLPSSMYPPQRLEFAQVDSAAQRVFSKLVGEVIRSMKGSFANDAVDLLRNPCTKYTSSFLMVAHRELGWEWRDSFPLIVRIAAEGLQDTDFKVVKRVQQALDALHEHYRESAPDFTDQLVDSVLSAMPLPKITRLLTKGLGMSDERDFKVGYSQHLSQNMARDIEGYLARRFPEGAYFSEVVGKAKNREIYNNFRWKGALENMGDNDKEAVLGSDLGL